MARFVLRRIALIPPALLLINFLGYAYAHLSRPLRAARTPYQFAMPDSGPLLPAYGEYLRGLLHLDLGMMPSGQQRSIAEAMASGLTASLGLLALALLGSALIGLLLGVVATRVSPPRAAQWLTVFSTVGLAMPSFYIGTLFVVGVVYTILRPDVAAVPIPLRGFGWDTHLLLPTIALMVRPTMQTARITSGLLAEELGKRYVVAARSFGYRWRVIRGHALRNILAPTILTLAGSLRLLVGELVLVEWLFAWPGIGRMLAETLIPSLLSTRAMNLAFLYPPLVAIILTVFAAIFLFTDLLATVLVRAADPRLRAQPEEVGDV